MVRTFMQRENTKVLEIVAVGKMATDLTEWGVLPLMKTATALKQLVS